MKTNDRTRNKQKLKNETQNERLGEEIHKKRGGIKTKVMK
jgi:hypothetical protein